jgi:hypothetical protein
LKKAGGKLTQVNGWALCKGRGITDSLRVFLKQSTNIRPNSSIYFATIDKIDNIMTKNNSILLIL